MGLKVVGGQSFFYNNIIPSGLIACQQSQRDGIIVEMDGSSQI